jgi:AraC family transcriptional regulator
MSFILKHRIEDRDGIRIVGLRFYISAEDLKNKMAVATLWNSLPQDTFNELKSLSDSAPTGVIGVFGEKRDGGFDYWIGASTTKQCPERYETIAIPPAKWIIFEAKGALPDSIQGVFGRLYSEWFAASEYARRWEVYELEWFTDGDVNSDSYICEAWVPVVEKTP